MANTPHQQQSDNPLEILLVEDNPGDVRLTKEAFKETEQKTSINVITDGDDAIHSLAQQAETEALPDLVLLDLTLPGCDGCAVLRAIRADPRLERLPVIMLTSSEADEDVQRCYNAHANAYLTKPTNPATFSALMENVEQFWFEAAHLPSASA